MVGLPLHIYLLDIVSLSKSPALRRYMGERCPADMQLETVANPLLVSYADTWISLASDFHRISSVMQQVPL